MINDLMNDVSHVLCTQQQLKAEVKRLGIEISRDYEGRQPIMVSVLKGAFVFMADLVREITVPCTIDFMSVSSYGSSTESSGRVKIIKDLDTNIENRDVIIVEDILDSGFQGALLFTWDETKHTRWTMEEQGGVIKEKLKPENIQWE